MRFELKRAAFCKALVGVDPSEPIRIVVDAVEGVYLERAADGDDEPLQLDINEWCIDPHDNEVGEATILAQCLLGVCRSAARAKSLMISVVSHRPDRLKVVAVGGQRAEWSFVLEPAPAPRPASVQSVGVLTIQTSSSVQQHTDGDVSENQNSSHCDPQPQEQENVNQRPSHPAPPEREPCINPACHTKQGELRHDGRYERSRGRCLACFNHIKEHGIERTP